MVDTYKIIITTRAQRSLENIIDYVRDNVSDATARKVRDGIDEAIEKVKKMPQANSIQRDITNEEMTYRRILQWSYRVIYYIDETTKTVFIVEIDHSRRNPETLKKVFNP